MNYKIIMITTHRDNLNIFNLLESLDNINNELTLLVVLVSQESLIKYIPKSKNLTIKFINEKKIGLSKARNIGLDYLLKNNITSEYIMFPDDDSTFDKNFSQEFIKILGSEKNYITPIYNTNSQKLYLGKPHKNGAKILIKNYYLVGSPNQVIQYNKYKELIYFNENLGVGAKYGSSEDLDLFIKLNLYGIKYFYNSLIYSYHPKKTNVYKNKTISDIIKRFKSYSSGFAVVIFEYKLYRFIPTFLFRTFAAFIYYIIKFNFKLSLAYLIQLLFRIKLLCYYSMKKNKNE
jgi:glycosyltransferase involved in cell wall biosynthesis